ncbi:polysaccharide biosynthesis tyrosine autokinase [Zunongwangia sp. F363]|uniref:non-specific protein-tyrosine kinase n=1 Tax=Autumnicola tepida TaxID=3075595 RepID=A0ABU3C831_9FLAO|nr:polysaccharide biosynthesis tyrosine autokinase [Zunongwangia sp. F363]MDT0642500.1 polysaccharide biosynthesis tyrosine autokinase [Zunongwangia sp. F363]
MNRASMAGKTEGKNIRTVVSGYLKYWYLFLIGLCICIGLAFWYLRYKAVPEYQISSTILIKDKDKGEGASGGGESFGDLGLIKPSRNIEDEIGILRSAGLMEKVIKQMDLQVKYYVEGKFDGVEVYSGNLPIRINRADSSYLLPQTFLSVQIKDNNSFVLAEINDGEHGTSSVYQFGELIQKPYGTFTVNRNEEVPVASVKDNIYVTFNSVEGLADYYTGNLSVEPVNDTGSLLFLSLTDPFPQRGKLIMENLIKAYTEKSIFYHNELAHNTINMIDERLAMLTEELTSVEKNVENYKQRNELTNVSSDAELYLQRASQSNQQLADYQTQIDVLNSIETYLAQQGDNAPTVPSTLNIEDPTLVNLISRLNELQLRRRSLLRTTPKDNPLVVEIDQQIKDLRASTLENLRNIKDGLVIAQRNVRQNLQQYESQVRKVPAAERQLLAINREQGTKQELYLYLLQKREEEALSLAAPISNTRIVDAPRAGSYPVSPNKTSIYLGALIFGLFLPFSIVYAKEKINDKVQDRSEIEEYTNVPILGEIANNREKEILVAKKENNTPVAELFRLIRFNLKFISAGKKNKTILVTSGKQGEGKTFFSINLGSSLASSGKKVIVLSFDLRAPKLMNDVGLSDDFGITDFLVDNELQIEDIIIPSPEIEGLYYIGSGAIPPNAGELMLSPKIEFLIKELEQSFDFVIIDSAPIGKVADAYALAPYVDSSVYVIRHDYTKKSELRIIEDIYQKNKLTRPMVVLNGTKTKEAYAYGYGYGQKKAMDRRPAAAFQK